MTLKRLRKIMPFASNQTSSLMSKWLPLINIFKTWWKKNVWWVKPGEYQWCGRISVLKMLVTSCTDCALQIRTLNVLSSIFPGTPFQPFANSDLSQTKLNFLKSVNNCTCYLHSQTKQFSSNIYLQIQPGNHRCLVHYQQV